MGICDKPSIKDLNEINVDDVVIPEYGQLTYAGASPSIEEISQVFQRHLHLNQGIAEKVGFICIRFLYRLYNYTGFFLELIWLNVYY